MVVGEQDLRGRFFGRFQRDGKKRIRSLNLACGASPHWNPDRGRERIGTSPRYRHRLSRILTIAGVVVGRASMPNPVTLTYKTVPALNFDSDSGPSDVPLYLDVYSPDSHLNGTSTSDDGSGVPAVVYFHAGGLLVGDRRRSWFPEWLHSECFLVPSIRLRLLTCVLFRTGRLSGQGIAFISADYRLLLPSTGHEIIEDIQDLFGYIRSDLNLALARGTGNPPLRINVDAIAVAGTSGGGLCAYLSAIHLSPKPKALLSIYGQGGECLVSHLRYPNRNPVSIFA